MAEIWNAAGLEAGDELFRSGSAEPVHMHGERQGAPVSCCTTCANLWRPPGSGWSLGLQRFGGLMCCTGHYVRLSVEDIREPLQFIQAELRRLTAHKMATHRRHCFLTAAKRRRRGP